MTLKSPLKFMLLLTAVGLAGQQAWAQASYVNPLNTALATSGLSCSACHTSSVPALKANATSWKQVTTSTDTDGDSFSDGMEVRMATDFFDATSKPSGASANGVFVSTATSVTTATATDLATETNSTFTLTGTDAILDSKSITPTLPTAGSITLAFEGFDVSSTNKVYQVVGSTATEITTVTSNGTGGITFTVTDAQPKLLIVGVASAATAATGGDASVYGCMTPANVAPWLFMMGLLLVAAYTGRSKKQV